MATTRRRRRVMLGIRLTPETRTAFRLWCMQRDQTMNDVLERRRAPPPAGASRGADPAQPGVGAADQAQELAAAAPVGAALTR